MALNKEDFSSLVENIDNNIFLNEDAENIESALVASNIKETLKLDYSLQTPEERNELIKKIIEKTPSEQLTPKYLEILTDYVILAIDKEERKEKKLLTPNRMVTVNKRETSFEGLVTKLENGEDGIYNMISDLGKNTILTPKVSITEKDLAEIPELARLREAIESVEKLYKTARGKKRFLLKKQIIEMRQDQYIIKNGHRQPIGANHVTKSISKLDFYDDFSFDENGNPINNGLISFFNPEHIEALLCNYSGLKEVSYGKFSNDLYYLMEDLDNLIEKTLKKDFPLYYDLLIYKIDEKTNVEIQNLLEQKHGIKHSIEYISSLWRNKIPKLLAEQAQEDYLIWYYRTQEKGNWKTCTRCGETKLAHNKFFSKNKSSKDGWYSLCKCCRNANSKKNQKKIVSKFRNFGRTIKIK